MRFCACGCGPLPDSMRSDALWRNEACQKKWLRENPGKSLRDAHSTDLAPTRKPSGLQVSFQKALKAATYAAVEARLAQGVPVSVLVERQLKRALPDLQRERLEQRRAA